MITACKAGAQVADTTRAAEWVKAALDKIGVHSDGVTTTPLAVSDHTCDTLPAHESDAGGVEVITASANSAASGRNTRAFSPSGSPVNTSAAAS